MSDTSRSNWYVLTGRPCSGISTTVAALAARGHRTVPEAARAVIDEKRALGVTARDVRADDRAFQHEVLERKIAAEARLPRQTLHILDRGLPDSAAYHELAGLDPERVLELCKPRLYEGVFFLEPLPWVRDYARTESELTLDWLGQKLRDVYIELGYAVTSIPVAPVCERVAHIESHFRTGSRPID